MQYVFPIYWEQLLAAEERCGKVRVEGANEPVGNTNLIKTGSFLCYLYTLFDSWVWVGKYSAKGLALL